MNEEIWKYIETSKDYMISNRGRVKSFVKNKNGSILNQDTGNSGHKRVMIKYPEPRTRHLVHRLVAIAFIENVLDDPEHHSLEGFSDELMKNSILVRKNEENSL